jgi:hypothetical protein
VEGGWGSGRVEGGVGEGVGRKYHEGGREGGDGQEAGCDDVERVWVFDEGLCRCRYVGLYVKSASSSLSTPANPVRPTAPSTLLHLRSRALLCYATTSTLYSAQEKLDAFYDQTRKVLLLYGRQAEQQKVGETLINEGVKSVFEEVLGVLEKKEAKRKGSAWTTLCEVVMHIAKRVSLLPLFPRLADWS